MELQRLLRQLRGPFAFLRMEPEEVRQLTLAYPGVLPHPQRIFLAREEATPIVGFPILQNDEEQALRVALEHYLEFEEEMQWARMRKRPSDAKGYRMAWQEYSGLLARATENGIGSSFGRRYPSIFWLYHSIAISRLLKEVPRRLARRDPDLARRRGDALKYRVFERFLDKVMQVTYNVVQRVAKQAEDREEDLFPQILYLMRENVLILSEDHVGPDLAQLGSYFRGYLKREPGELLRGVEAAGAWLVSVLEVDESLREALSRLNGAELPSDPSELLRRAGMLRFVAAWPGFPRSELSADDIELWELLVTRLKEFELLLGLRRLMIPVRQDAARGLVCKGTFWSVGVREMALSESTRPLDFMRPWVVDPKVSRFGLIYDITDFSAILSVLGRSGVDQQDRSFRRVFRFQRRVNLLARRQRLQLEKYLGDGALYSGRHPGRLLAVALGLQRYYRRALEEGFPFDRGMRIALNYGTYRLLPIEGGQASAEGLRYEFFGQGIVELTRLVTGKAMRDIDETKTLLVGLGYPQTEVDAFFAPVTSQNVDLIDRIEEDRRFYAYINANGALVNEGIVATERFIQRLEERERPRLVGRVRDGRRSYVVCELEDSGETLRVALRKLGRASFKGIGKLTIFEILDPEPWGEGVGEPLGSDSLTAALEEDALTATRTGLRSRTS